MLITATCAVAYSNTNTAYVYIPAPCDTLAEKHVAKILKCLTISAAPVVATVLYIFFWLLCG